MKTTRQIIDYLAQNDRVFVELYCKYGLLETNNSLDLFSSFIYHFIDQMLSNKVANVIFERFKILIGNLSPDSILKVEDSEIRKCGISYKKIEFIKSFCFGVKNGTIDLEYIQTLNDTDLIKELTKIKGVGEWTAEMIACFNLGRPNIFSYKDVALRNGILKVHKEFKTLSLKRFERLRKLYSPYCSYASLYYYRVNDDKEFCIE